MKFTKMQGLGNDYVYVNGFEERIENPSEMAVKVSNRNFGVGSDGLILINPSEKADFEMEMYNADGSRGEMCGNGIRCVAKYVYDYGLTDKTHISVETLGGIKYLDLTVEDGKVVLVRVDMGSPILTPAQIPVIADEAEAVAVPILVDETEYQMTCVSMGNPHAVIFMDDIEHLEIEKIGPNFEHHERFPNRVNTEFVKVLDRHTASMRVWERGSGETLACGTGACAVAYTAITLGKAGRRDQFLTVEAVGGPLQLNYRSDGHMMMKGPAVTVYEGEMEIPDNILK